MTREEKENLIIETTYIVLVLLINLFTHMTLVHVFLTTFIFVDYIRFMIGFIKNMIERMDAIEKMSTKIDIMFDEYMSK